MTAVIYFRVRRQAADFHRQTRSRVAFVGRGKQEVRGGQGSKRIPVQVYRGHPGQESGEGMIITTYLPTLGFI